MPGFFVNGAGGVAGQPSNTTETRRAHRWVFRYLGKGASQFKPASLLLMKTASRPKFKLEQPELHHDQEVAYFAGKQSWETMKLEWYDGEQDPDVSAEVIEWFETVTNFTTANVNHPRYYKGVAELALTNGQAQPTQLWTMYGVWPVAYDGGELDYTSTEILLVSAEIRYDRAKPGCFAAPAATYVGPSCPQ